MEAAGFVDGQLTTYIPKLGMRNSLVLAAAVGLLSAISIFVRIYTFATIKGVKEIWNIIRKAGKNLAANFGPIIES